MGKKLLKLCVLVGNIGVPTSAFLFFSSSQKSLSDFLFLIFIVVHALERVWETFFTTSEKKNLELHGDWTLAATAIAYIMLCFLIIYEFYILTPFINYYILTLGICFYVLAFFIRRWGRHALGKQWAVHAIGAQKIKKVRIIRLGPYKYIRHPIYLGIIFELLSLPLIANAFLSLLFVLCFNIPLQLIRMNLEEKASLRRFGSAYLDYKKTTGAFFPFQYIRKLR